AASVAPSRSPAQAAPDPEPLPGPDQRTWRIPVDIDDDYFPAHRPPGMPAEASPPRPADATTVPVWAVRASTLTSRAEAAGPQFLTELSLDPMSLDRKAAIRSGASSVQVDEQHLRLRTWFRRVAIPWTDVRGFEAHSDSLDEAPSSTGHVVALTSAGPVEMPGTRRRMSELRHVHALLDAYRIRAHRLANG
ncbi:MAG: PH domain-containing protein, partial [Jatrophihabitantaceae bacterium]